MKITLALLSLVFSLTAVAKDVTLNATSLARLNSQDAKIRILLPYPGAELSGLCGIELRSTYGEVNRLLEELEFDHPVQVLNPRALEIDLSAHAGTYLAFTSISTKRKVPLAVAIRAALYGGELIMIATSCR